MYRKAIINISVRIGNRYSTINGALMALVGDQSALGSGVIYYSHHMPPSLPSPFSLSLLSFPFSSLLSRFPFFPSLINGVFCYEAGRIRLELVLREGRGRSECCICEEQEKNSSSSSLISHICNSHLSSFARQMSVNFSFQLAVSGCGQLMQIAASLYG